MQLGVAGGSRRRRRRRSGPPAGSPTSSAAAAATSAKRSWPTNDLRVAVADDVGDLGADEVVVDRREVPARSAWRRGTARSSRRRSAARRRWCRRARARAPAARARRRLALPSSSPAVCSPPSGSTSTTRSGSAAACRKKPKVSHGPATRTCFSSARYASAPWRSTDVLTRSAGHRVPVPPHDRAGHRGLPHRAARAGARRHPRRATAGCSCRPTEYDPATGEELDELVEVGPGGTVTTWAWVARRRAEAPARPTRSRGR